MRHAERLPHEALSQRVDEVVQSILFFVLGFLCAGFLALLVAPAVWRRAVALTSRRIEGSAPLTRAEIAAEKDQVRAAFAMEARRLEMTAEALQDKAAGQAVEIGRLGQQLAAAAAGNARKDEAIAALEARAAALEAGIGEREEKLAQLAGDLAGAEKLIERRGGEMDKLGQMYDEASFLASSRQIELVAREAELEKLAADMLALRNQRKEAEARSREIVAESRTAREALKAEQKRVADLDKRIERLLGVVAEREERLERRERELVRLREKLKGAPSARVGTQAAGAKAVAAPPRASEIDRATARLDAGRARLEARLEKLADESRKATEGAARNGSGRGERPGEGREGAELRNELADLAAEAVHLAALRDGPASPILKALAADEGRAAPAADGRRRAVSLAERVRALQKATPAG